jgi:hypothetical protein
MIYNVVPILFLYFLIWTTYRKGFWYLIYVFTVIESTPGGGSTVNIHTQTIHRTTQLTTLGGRFSGIRTQSGHTKINVELTA